MKSESPLKAKLMEVLREDLPGCVAIRHEDIRTSGIPDLSVDGWSRGSWWEVKHATPNFESKGIQEVTCLNLAAAHHCRYIVYWEDGLLKETRIIHPREVLNKKGKVADMTIELFAHGFDHHWVAKVIKRTLQP